MDVSGGERQKLAIARAVYKDAPVMILDEPTAVLDLVVEADIYPHFNRISAQKTVVFVSHRLSSCQFCDCILVLQEGRLVQTGTHQQLLNQEGEYALMWNKQARHYQENVQIAENK